MPPRQPPVAPEQQELPFDAAALAAITGPALAEPAAGTAAVAPTAAAATAAAKPIIAAFKRAFDQRNSDLEEELLLLYRWEYAGADERVLKAVIRDEMRLERIFQGKMLKRLREDLRDALRAPDSFQRRERLRKVVDREKRYGRLREESLARRMSGRMRLAALKLESPRGAYWKLSPNVRSHTWDCLVMGEKWWPHSVLERVNPANRHHGCACELLGEDEAVRLGLITPDLIPDERDAVARARRYAEDIPELKRLAEAMWTRGEVPGDMSDFMHRALNELRKQKGKAPHPDPNDALRRWPKGFAKGGQFRPKRGGSPGALLKELIPELESPSLRHGYRSGRIVALRGEPTFVAEQEELDLDIDGVNFRSPLGGTNVYRNGRLVSEPGRAPKHPDVDFDAKTPPAPKAPDPLGPAVALVRDGNQLRERIRTLTPRHDTDAPPVRKGDPLGVAMAALQEMGFFRNTTRAEGPTTHIELLNPDTGAVMDITELDGEVREVVWLPQGRRAERRAPSFGPPATFDDFKADVLAWQDEVAARWGMAGASVRVVTDDEFSDHAGKHNWDMTVHLGRDVEPSVAAAAAQRVSGQPVEGDLARQVAATYRLAGHELAHGINPARPVTFDAEIRDLEEGLTEEMGWTLAVQRLREQGQDDVLQWVADHPHDLTVLGGYSEYRALVEATLWEAGIPPERWEQAIGELKFQVSPERRPQVLVEMVSAANGISQEDAVQRIVTRAAQTADVVPRPILAPDLGTRRTISLEDPVQVAPHLAVRPGDLIGKNTTELQARVLEAGPGWLVVQTPNGDAVSIAGSELDAIHPAEGAAQDGAERFNVGDLIHYARTDGGVSEARVMEVRRAGFDYEMVLETTENSAQPGARFVMNPRRNLGLRHANGEELRTAALHRMPWEAEEAAQAAARGDIFEKPPLPEPPFSPSAGFDDAQSAEFGRQVADALENRPGSVHSAMTAHPVAYEGYTLRGDKSSESWSEYAKLKGDPAAVEAVETAMQANRASPLFAEIEARFGPDIVLPHTGDFDFYGGLDAHPHAKRVGPVTYAYLLATASPAPKRDRPTPGMSGSVDRGLAAILRHEYAHELWTRIGAERQADFIQSLPTRRATFSSPVGEVETFERDLPDLDAIAEGLTKYAGGRGQMVPRLNEAFTELFAVTTDPEFRERDWPEWVVRSRDTMFKALRDEPALPTAPASPGFDATTAYVQMDDATERIRGHYESFSHDGTRVEITRLRSHEPGRLRTGASVEVRGKIMRGQTYVGEFRRTFEKQENGFFVHHNQLHIADTEHGAGMAAAFNAHNEQLYRNMGVDAIFLTAADIGSYAWARSGYTFHQDGATDKASRADAARALMEQGESPEIAEAEGRMVLRDELIGAGVPSELLEEFFAKFATRAEIRAYRNGDEGALDGKFTHEAEIAAWGRDRFRWEGGSQFREQTFPMWLGKAFFISQAIYWDGVKVLGADLQEAPAIDLSQLHDEWAANHDGIIFGTDQPDGHLYWADDEEFWEMAERRGLVPGDALEEADVWREYLHPRNRVGRFREKFGGLVADFGRWLGNRLGVDPFDVDVDKLLTHAGECALPRQTRLPGGSPCFHSKSLDFGVHVLLPAMLRERFPEAAKRLNETSPRWGRLGKNSSLASLPSLNPQEARSGEAELEKAIDELFNSLGIDGEGAGERFGSMAASGALVRSDPRLNRVFDLAVESGMIAEIKEEFGGGGELQEADFHEHLHPRDRLGRFIRTFRGLLDVFVVGGAVRDGLLGKEPKDIDLMARGTPDQIKAAVEELGHTAEELIVRDRVVGVRAYGRDLPPEGVEIAPPRIEKSTGPSRHDFEIVPHPDPGSRDAVALDAERRDFTVNALYRDPATGEVVDPTGKGIPDLEKRVLRTTHPDSFRDDPLRILRAARFASQHGLDPDEETFRQMEEHAGAITALTQKGVSGTVETELNKLLLGDGPARGLRLLRDTGALAVLLPELEESIGFDQESRWHVDTVDEHIFKVVDDLAKRNAPLPVRLAALFHDSGKPESSWRGEDGRLHYYGNPELGKRDHADIGAERADAALRRMNYPAEVRTRVRAIVQNHMLQANRPSPVKARKARARLGDELLRDVIMHRRSDVSSKGEDDAGFIDRLDEFEQLVEQERDAPVTVADLSINGDDLIELGYPQGPIIGETLDMLLRQVIGQPKLNEAPWLLKQAKKQLRKVEAQDQQGDLPVLRDPETGAFAVPGEMPITDELKIPGMELVRYEIRADEKDIGYIDLMLEPGEGEVEVLMVHLNEKHRGEGIMSRLLGAALPVFSAGGYTELRWAAVTPGGAALGERVMDAGGQGSHRVDLPAAPASPDVGDRVRVIDEILDGYRDEELGLHVASEGSFPDGQSHTSLHYRIMADDGVRPVGFIDLSVATNDPEKVFVESIGLNKPYRRQGFATRLAQATVPALHEAGFTRFGAMPISDDGQAALKTLGRIRSPDGDLSPMLSPGFPEVPGGFTVDYPGFGEQRVHFAEVKGAATETRVIGAYLFAAEGSPLVVGALSLDPPSGEVEIVGVDENVQRQGLATKLLKVARAHTGLPLKKTSRDRSEAGIGFSEALGLEMPEGGRVADPREGRAWYARLATGISPSMNAVELDWIGERDALPPAPSSDLEARDALWRRPEPDLPEGHQDWNEEERNRGVNAWQVEKRRWEASVRKALSLGKLTDEEAREKGYRDGRGPWQPLPARLWHVTTNPDAVEDSGSLKTRDELGMSRGGGLGAGPSDLISLTDDYETAVAIRDAMQEMGRIMRGDITPEEIIEQARTGVGADRPYLDKMMRYFHGGWEPGGDWPEEIKRLLGEEKYQYRSLMLPKTADEIINGDDPTYGGGWEPDPAAVAPDGRYLGARRIPDDRNHQLKRLADSMFAFREDAGGSLNPVFMGVSEDGLRRMGESVAIVEVTPVEGAQGKQAGALGEWRTGTGAALHIANIDRGSAPQNALPVAEVSALPAAPASVPSVRGEFLEEVKRRRRTPGRGRALTRYVRGDDSDGQLTALEELAEQFGYESVEDYELSVQRRLERLTEDAQVAVRVPGRVVEQFVGGGGLRNAHHPETPKEIDYSGRLDAERRVWRINGNPDAHPIYGYLAEPDENVAENPVSGFGDVKLVLKYEVKDRTYFTYSDFNWTGIADHNGAPAPVLDPRPEAVPYQVTVEGVEQLTPRHGVGRNPEPDNPPREVREAEERWRRGVAFWDEDHPTVQNDWDAYQTAKSRWLARLQDEGKWFPWNSGDFFEAQIFGGVRVEDVAEVVFPDNGTDYSKAQAALDDAGVLWRMDEVKTS